MGQAFLPPLKTFHEGSLNYLLVDGSPDPKTGFPVTLTTNNSEDELDYCTDRGCDIEYRCHKY